MGHHLNYRLLLNSNQLDSQVPERLQLACMVGMVSGKAERNTNVSFTLDEGTGRIDFSRCELSDTVNEALTRTRQVPPVLPSRTAIQQYLQSRNRLLILEMELKLHPDLKGPVRALCEDESTTFIVLSGSDHKAIALEAHVNQSGSSLVILICPPARLDARRNRRRFSR